MKQTVLITGASNGIGKACARVFARKGYDLVLVARNEEKLEQVKAEICARYDRRVEVIVMDLTWEDAAIDLYNELELRNIDIDILVNNAGFGDHGAFCESDWNTQKRMVALNITALMQLCYVFGNHMQEKQSGKIMNIASLAGLCPGPYMSVYYATKAFVLSFSEALAEEMQSHGVKVTCICPGPVDTGFMETAHLQKSSMFRVFPASKASALAKLAVDALMNNRTVVLQGVAGVLLNMSVRLMPRIVVRKAVALVNEKDKEDQTWHKSIIMKEKRFYVFS